MKLAAPSAFIHCNYRKGVNQASAPTQEESRSALAAHQAIMVARKTSPKHPALSSMTTQGPSGFPEDRFKRGITCSETSTDLSAEGKRCDALALVLN